jgi:hypothetical protein
MAFVEFRDVIKYHLRGSLQLNNRRPFHVYVACVASHPYLRVVQHLRPWVPRIVVIINQSNSWSLCYLVTTFSF